MTPEELEKTRRWVENWKTLGPELERMREEDVRNANTIRAFEKFTGMAILASKRFPAEPTSGLVEQQRWFMKLAKQRERTRE